MIREEGGTTDIRAITAPTSAAAQDD